MRILTRSPPSQRSRARCLRLRRLRTSKGVPCKYKAQEKYAGFCGYHKMAGRAEVERVTADMARTEIGGSV